MTKTTEPPLKQILVRAGSLDGTVSIVYACKKRSVLCTVGMAVSRHPFLHLNLPINQRKCHVHIELNSHLRISPTRSLCTHPSIVADKLCIHLEASRSAATVGISQINVSSRQHQHNSHLLASPIRSPCTHPAIGARQSSGYLACSSVT